MGNDNSSGQPVQVLQPNSFFEEKLDRGGYRILASNSDSFTFSDRKHRNIGMDLYFDLIVAVDSVECHDPEELNDRNFHKYMAKVRSKVYSDTCDWLKNLTECNTEDDYDEYLMLQPSQVITIHVLNIRTMKFRQIENRIKAEVSATSDNRSKIEIPPLGLRIVFMKTCEMIRQFYSISDIDQNSILNANSINLDAEILVGYALWESEDYGFRYYPLPKDPLNFAGHLEDSKNKTLQLFLYDHRARSRRTIEVPSMIDTGSNSSNRVLGMTADNRVQIWSDMIRIKPDDPELNGTAANSQLNKPQFVDNLHDCGVVPAVMDTIKLASLKGLSILEDPSMDTFPLQSEDKPSPVQCTSSQDINQSSELPYPIPMLASTKRTVIISSIQEKETVGDGAILSAGDDPTVPTRYVETVSFDPLEPSTILPAVIDSRRKAGPMDMLLPSILAKDKSEGPDTTGITISIAGVKVKEQLEEEERDNEVETSTPRWADEERITQSKRWLNQHPQYLEVCLEICKRNYCENLEDLQSYLRQIDKVSERKVQRRAPTEAFSLQSKR